MWVSAMCELVERVDQGLERARDEFQPISRYRSRCRQWSVNENSVKRTGSTGCRSLGWYYALTPVKPVTISNEQSVFAADVWRRSTNAYEDWALQAFPVRDREIP